MKENNEDVFLKNKSRKKIKVKKKKVIGLCMQDHCMEMYEEYRKSNRIIIKYLEVKSDQNEKKE